MSKRATKAAPQPDSFRSIRRKNRGFVNLETSSRKHRRANKRRTIASTISGVLYEPGTKVIPNIGGKIKVFMATAGGALHYH